MPSCPLILLPAEDGHCHIIEGVISSDALVGAFQMPDAVPSWCQLAFPKKRPCVVSAALGYGLRCLGYNPPVPDKSSKRAAMASLRTRP